MTIEITLLGTGSPLPPPHRQWGHCPAANRRSADTHPVPAPQPDAEAEWIALAAEVFDGEIVMGPDLTVVTV